MLIPTPKWKEVDDYVPPPPSTDSAHVKQFWNVRPWRCTCGLTNFGRNKHCADYRCKKLRPTDFVEVAR